ncbi:hypothetical protein [Staphylococcus delphini]|uniref:Uncharacterized protein n=1 Tax=Staphylococcus delphini TaxID=53344 RepID=A0AAQ0M278_9STAP|nr:hypothetical protein [Staphylococcus delphini]MDE9751973.1 hypothetical protein [Staphylococcus delphini]MDE9789186.1 hypothetical protein [Staphylococcus delphini]MDE9792296.1 hypothetical protein [Staphylococcus delphini]MDE9794108.1 hypothetical protein [Staphylococcus delphini]MDE9797092.1 hypothetical protein [Staphylococcus delphini]
MNIIALFIIILLAVVLFRVSVSIIGFLIRLGLMILVVYLGYQLFLWFVNYI